jgi:predicted AAA+ superfamily ATPase
MREIFEQLILDFHNSKLPVPSKREINVLPFSENVRKAYIFIGMRRSGKTWAMYQIMNELLSQGLDKTKIVYINFEDDRLISMGTKDFQSILDAYFGLYPQYLERQDLYFFFDEIHEVKGWEQFIRRILDQEKMHIYIS